jgi:hypothetical protein
MKNIKLITVLAAMTLGLNACGAPESEVQEVTDDAGDNLNKTTDAALVEDKDSEPKNETPESFSEDDREKIVLYGTCSSILKAMVFSINKQNLYSDPAVKLMRSTFAHQATIYSILNVDRINQYPKNLHEEGLKLSNDFMNENILNNSLTIAQLNEMNKSKCNFQDVADLSGFIMKENRSNYEEELEIIKSLGL